MARKKFCGTPVYRQFYGARAEQMAARGCMCASDAMRSVYYTGPCPDADPCDRTNWYADNWIDSYGFYANEGALSVPGGSALTLSDSVYSIGPVQMNAGMVTLGENALYTAAITLTGLAQAAIGGYLQLLLNNTVILSVPLSYESGETVQEIARVQFNANAGDVLRLIPTGPIALTGTPAATMVVFG